MRPPVAAAVVAAAVLVLVWYIASERVGEGDVEPPMSEPVDAADASASPTPRGGDSSTLSAVPTSASPRPSIVFSAVETTSTSERDKLTVQTASTSEGGELILQTASTSAGAPQSCAEDGMPAPVLPSQPPWRMDVSRLSAATTFPELRALLSGREPAEVPESLAGVLLPYKRLHADIMAGRLPLRVWVMRGCSARLTCGGLGDRMKSLRMSFYLAVLSSRALLIDDWSPSLSDVFDAGDVEWRLDYAPPASRTPARSVVMFEDTPNAAIATAMAAAAFSDVAVVQGYTNRFPTALVANATRRFVCDDGGVNVDGDRGVVDGGSDSGVAVAACAPLALWSAIFEPVDGHIAPIGPMLDFLFRPHPAFLADTLVPMLQAMPLWLHAASRVGVHLRTHAADGQPPFDVARYYSGCLRCFIASVNDSAAGLGVGVGVGASADVGVGVGVAAATVLVLSDDRDSVLVLRSLLPPGCVSSPRLAPDDTERVVHIDKPRVSHLAADEVRRGVRRLFAEFVLLSAADAVLHSRSGFSKVAVMWGRIPPANVRMMPIRDGARAWSSCQPSAYRPDYYNEDW